jgi:hypothetical protein
MFVISGPLTSSTCLEFSQTIVAQGYSSQLKIGADDENCYIFIFIPNSTLEIFPYTSLLSATDQKKLMQTLVNPCGALAASNLNCYSTQLQTTAQIQTLRDQKILSVSVIRNFANQFFQFDFSLHMYEK